MTSFITLLLGLALASSGVFSIPPDMKNRKAEEDDNEVVFLDDDEDTAEPPDAIDAIETANARLGNTRGGRSVRFGDIVQPSRSRNANPCTATGCKWPKSKDGYVHVPVTISSKYSRAERRVIIRSLVEFHSVTCICFVHRRGHRDYIDFQPSTGCWSSLGRQDRGQVISLQKDGCVSKRVIQHEVLHALGFHHEQSRSDRDNFVNILYRNIQPGKNHNFRKVATNNLGTPYDYNSIMHYSRYAFSKRRGVLPTIVPKPYSKVTIGEATKMSINDIRRVNQLYQCYN